MPVLSAFLATVFSALFGWFRAFAGLKFAAVSAFIVTSLGTFIAAKAVMWGIKTALTAITTPSLVAMLSYFLPDNLSACVSVIVLSDAVMAYYENFKENLRAIQFIG